MGKVVERKRRKKKKKGRPSLLDLQKRSIKEQQQQQKQQLKQLQEPQKRTPNPNFKTCPITPNSFRRSTHRNPNPDGDLSAAENNEAVGDENDELTGKLREKKLKLVLTLPSQRSSLHSSSLNSDSYNSVSNAEDDIDAANHKKRKVNAIGDGSGKGHTEKEEKQVSPPKPTQALQGTQLDMGPSTPLPDKKLLLFIIDRLQKKDTYGVFSGPVDPNELPDYHEVIEHPMDFGTVRKKLASGAYANMEQFEKDVFLICSNAMQYNGSDTIYFRQARSIEELAKKSFENLRQDSDDNEPERKIVRRGRPPTKKMLWPSLERAGLDFSLDATLATQAENPTWSNYDQKKGPLFEKSGPADDSGRSFLGSHNSEPYSGRLAEHKFERNGEFTGSILKGNWMKNGKKQVRFGENRRNTYRQSHLSTGGREPSVLTTFDGERKQLMTVGLHSEYGYARSLARFVANLGPVAWKVASMKIEKSLPAGINFGPGWVGENEAVAPRPLVLPSPAPIQLSPSHPFSMPGNSSKLSIVEMRNGKSLEDPERNNQYEKCMPSTCSDSDSHPSRLLLSPPPTSSSPVVANRSPETITESSEANRGLTSHSSFNMLSGNVGLIRPSPPFQILQNPVFRDGMNGVNGAYGFYFPVQMGKQTGSVRPTGIKFQSSRIDDTVSRANSSVVHPAAANSLSSGDSKLLENTGRINSGTSLPKAGCKGLATPKMGHQSPASWQDVSQQQKPDSVPPDLNIRFQTPGSPNSSRVDSTQTDLALQL